MSDDRDENKTQQAQDLAYTTSAEAEGPFQFHSKLEPDAAAAQPARTQTVRPILLLLLLLLLLLVAVSTAMFLIRYDVSLQGGVGGFRLLVTRRGTAGVEGNGVVGSGEYGDQQYADRTWPHKDYQWDGATLDVAPIQAENHLSYAQLYKKCAASVVTVTATTANGSSLGTGIIISQDGAIIASSHVIMDAEALQVTVAGTDYAAYVIGLDYASDLAVIKIEAEGLMPALFGDSGQVQAGDEIAVVGNPVAGVVNITDGIISAVNQTYRYKGFPLGVLQLYMTLGTQASGSPLVNLSGQVVGIVNTDIAAQHPEAGGISFAVTSQAAKPIVDELLQNGFIAGRPASGLVVTEIPAAYVAYYRYPSSLYISAVSQTSTAYAAGVRRGDLIVSANGQALETVDQLYTIINSLKAGDMLTLELFRERETGFITFELMDAAQLAN